MTIDKAIELLVDEARSPRYTFDPDQVAAFRLGIEALKEYKRLRALRLIPSSVPLPGETKG